MTNIAYADNSTQIISDFKEEFVRFQNDSLNEHKGLEVGLREIESNIEQITTVEEENEINKLKKIFDDIWKNDTKKKNRFKARSYESTFKISQKEQAISDAKNFLLEKSQFYPLKELMFITREMLRANYHFGDIRLENYLKIALSDLKIKHEFNLDGRQKKRQVQKKYTFDQIRKKYPMAYEPWTKSADELLKKFWHEKSNQQSRDETIRELMEEFGRNRGAIVSRLKKLGLE